MNKKWLIGLAVGLALVAGLLSVPASTMSPIINDSRNFRCLVFDEVLKQRKISVWSATNSGICHQPIQNAHLGNFESVLEVRNGKVLAIYNPQRLSVTGWDALSDWFATLTGHLTGR